MKFEIQRKKLIYHVKTQLLCTLGSMSVGVTLPILMGLYRDDTDEEIAEFSQILGFPSLEAMLQSEEFEDVVACDFTENALGGGVGRSEKVFCYRVVPAERIVHITKNICDAAKEKDRLAMQRDYKERSQLGNPIFNPKILEGKIRLLSCVAKLNGEVEPVSVFDLQKEYYSKYNVFLDRPELRRWFGKKHIKHIFDVFCFNDVEVSTDVERNGSLYIIMKRPLAQIFEECNQMSQDVSLSSRDILRNFSQDMAEPSNKVEKHKPILIPLHSKNEKYFTNDALLARKFGGMDNHNSTCSLQYPTDSNMPKFALNEGFSSSTTCPQSDYETLSEKPNIRDFEIIPGLSNNNGRPVTSLPPLKSRMINPTGVEKSRIAEYKHPSIQEMYDNNGSTVNSKQEWSSNVTSSKKDPLKYTSRGSGTYTDNESSDDEHMASNGFILSQAPSKTRAGGTHTMEEPITNGWEKLNKSQWPYQSSVYREFSNPGLVEITDNSPRATSVHAEKYMKRAAEFKADSRARFMAEKLAESQKKKYDVDNTGPNQQLQGYPLAHGISNSHSRFTDFCVTEKASDHTFPMVRDSFGIQELGEENGVAVAARKNSWECANNSWDDSQSKAQLSQPPCEQPSFGQVKRAPQPALKQPIIDFGDNQASYSNDVHSYKNSQAGQLPDEVRILAAYITSILMTRQSITVSQLDDLIVAIYGKKLNPKQGAFVEESWSAFVRKYCGKYVDVVYSSNPILVWKQDMGEEVRKAMTQMGLQCASTSGTSNPVYLNGF